MVIYETTTTTAEPLSAQQRTLRPAMVGLVLLAASAGLLECALNTLDSPTRAVVWIGLAMAAFVYGILGLLTSKWGTRRALGSWRLGPWMMLWCGTTYGLASVTWSQPQTGTATEIAVSSVLRAMWLVAVGIGMWTLGYLAGPGHHVRAGAGRVVSSLQRRFSAEVRSPLVPWYLYALGTAARVISILVTRRFGYIGDAASAVNTASGYDQIINQLSFCAPLALGAAALQVFRERMTGARITLAVLFMSEIISAAVSGYKENYVIAVLAVAIPFSVARRRLPKVSLAILALIFLVVVIPFTQAYRDVARSDSTSLTATQAIDAAPSILRETLTSSGDALSAVTNSVSYLLQRSRDIDSPAIILQRTPGQIAFSSPADLVVGPLAALVPRALWPGKPILATGYQFGQQYFDVPSTVYSSTTITPIGDLYRHGGWVPVIVGMFFLGCGIRLLDDILDVRVNPQAIFLLLLLFPSLVMSEQDWITLLAGIPGSVLLWVFAVMITFCRRRATALADTS